MKHYHAKPSEQLPKYIKSLQDDTEHVVMKLETSLNWTNHKNVHCIQLCNVRLRTYACASLFICQLDKSHDVTKLARYR